MLNRFEVAIIGGGVVGAAIARELSRYHLTVALLEKEIELAFGVSKSNSGIIHPGTQNPPDSLKGRLCVEGNRLVRSLARELGVHFQEVGELIVIFREEDRPELLRLKAEAEQLGVPRLAIVGRGWLRQHEPGLNPEVIAALYAPTAGIISPYRFTYDLAENAQRNGVTLLTQYEVIGLAPGPGGFKLDVKGREPLHARFVVNTAGLQADTIARLAGIQDLTIVPRKGEEYLLDKKREPIARHLIFPLPTATSKGILMIKTSDGNPMIGPTAEVVEDKTDRSTSDAGFDQVLAAAQRLIPAVLAKDIIASFAGLRATVGSDFIIRHESKVPGLITVAGIQSPGLTASPAIARRVARLLLEQGLRLRRKWFFHRHRPASVHLFALSFSRIRRLLRRRPAYGDMVCRCEMVSAQEVRDAIHRGARTLDGIKFRTRAQAGRCHGGFCTTRLMKILAEETGIPLTQVTKRGPGSELVLADRAEQP